MRLKLTFLSLVATILAAHAATPIYLDNSAPMDQRIEDALSRMTLEEKVAMTHAQSKFSSAGVPRLGIPDVWMTDGPHGIRTEVQWDAWDTAGWTNDYCVAFPALTCLAASWDENMSAIYGKSIGEEARFRHKAVLLGPGVNIYRTPLNGRNFEYMGEDPYLASKMVVPYIQEVQKIGVATCVKHYALNNHEINRHTTNVVVDDRALHEIYLPAFKAAVLEGKTWAIMGAYNIYKKQHASHNQYLLNDILKGDWNFDGVVVSDWGGAHDTDEAITNGLDMEFGTWGLGESNTSSYDNYCLANPYLERIKSGKCGTKELDDKVRRILRLLLRTEMKPNRPLGSLRSDEHYEAARQIGEAGIVLLKNKNNILPIDPAKTKSIAVIGENAIKMMTINGGSSSLKVEREISPLDGLRAEFGDKIEITYARGYVGDTNNSYNGYTTGEDLTDDRTPQELTREAVEVAKNADCVIFVGGLNKSNGQDCEDNDRAGLNLPYGQDELIEAVAKANKNIIYVNISGNAVAMPWVNDVAAIIQGWYVGSEAGNALANVISGDVNPSGKLPFSFPKRLEDVAAHAMGEYVAERSGTEVIDVEYKESILVGYRWYDTKKIEPLFPFGHGLSYTTFKYSKPRLSKSEMSKDGKITVTLEVTNSGKRTGAEVVQLYIADLKSSLPRPTKELKGFKKITLDPNETMSVSFTIDRDALSYYDDTKGCWVAESGEFEAIVAASAEDIRGKAKFTLK